MMSNEQRQDIEALQKAYLSILEKTIKNNQLNHEHRLVIQKLVTTSALLDVKVDLFQSTETSARKKSHLLIDEMMNIEQRNNETLLQGTNSNEPK